MSSSPRSRARASVLAAAALLAAGCGNTRDRPRAPSDAERAAAAAPALTDLRESRFDQAQAAADAVLAADGGNAQAAVVRAITRYQSAMHQLILDFETVVEGADRSGGFNHEYMRASLEKTQRALEAIDADLAVAAADPGFSFELCLACWKYDWNRNGEVDDRDMKLLQVELDASGEELPENDPRRTPTFRFDIGDVYWARAMISFQRATIELILAYQWNELDKVLESFWRGPPPTIVIKLGDGARVKKARSLILAGLDFADQARVAYLAETDDDREWVPNPRQKNHPLPLPVDETLFETWAGVVGDVRRLIASEEGIDVAELAQLGDDHWDSPPHGFLDVGKMLSEPKDLVIEIGVLEKIDDDDAPATERALRSFFGSVYVEHMKPSPIVRRLSRMKGELDRNEDTFGRKLRYLFWLN